MFLLDLYIDWSVFVKIYFIITILWLFCCSNSAALIDAKETALYIESSFCCCQYQWCWMRVSVMWHTHVMKATWWYFIPFYYLFYRDVAFLPGFYSFSKVLSHNCGCEDAGFLWVMHYKSYYIILHRSAVLSRSTLQSNFFSLVNFQALWGIGLI